MQILEFEHMETNSCFSPVQCHFITAEEDMKYIIERAAVKPETVRYREETVIVLWPFVCLRAA